MIKNTNSLDEYLLKQSVSSTATGNGISSVFRAILEPVLETHTDGLESDVIFKVTNRDMFTGLLTRLEFSDINFVDYGDDVKGREQLDETDFLLVMTSDFMSFFAWKFVGNEFVYSCFTNTEEINTIINLLNENTDKDLSYLKEKYNTDKLKKNLTNSCINKLASMLSTATPVNTDVIDNEDLSEKINTITKKARYISHEIKNQLSICDLYSGIIKKFCEYNNINEKTINNAVECIDKSVKITGYTLNQLKSLNSKELKLYKTNKLIDTAVNLAGAYLENRNIELIVNNNVEDEIFVDKTLFISTIINLVKNACEAFDDTEEKGNKIEVQTKIDNDSVLIHIINNAKPISNPEKIFDEGMTTKPTGSGLGLFICKKYTEEQCGQIKLLKSDEDSTIFELRFCL